MITECSDELLLSIYWKGWNECFYSIDRSEEYVGLQKAAYDLGWTNYIVGDDVTSVDGWSDDFILKQIRL